MKRWKWTPSSNSVKCILALKCDGLLMLMVSAPSPNAVARATIAAGVVETLAAEWQDLARDASEPNAFGEPWFICPALSHLRGDRDVHLADVRSDDGALIGIMPLTLYTRYGRMSVRHVSNWTHYQCFMGTPLVKAGYETAFWMAIIALLDDSDWAAGLFTVSGLLEDGPVHQGLIAAAATLKRPSPIVHRHDRAALSSTLTPETYLDTHVRGKKRKELRRLANRLRDLGVVEFNVMETEGALPTWCDDFLILESAGWKGEHGAALGNTPQTTAFFKEMMAGAFAAGALDFQRITLDGRPIAMLINFRTPPGSWSFKIAYDENLARYSPGVLIELENLPRVLNDPVIAWMDSCAVADHSMINSFWAERRSIVQISIPLSGTRRALTYHACRSAEIASAWLRKIRT